MGDATLRAASAGERVADRDPPDRRYGTIVVVGGGCYGSYYVRQLSRARDAGAIEWERLVVVDRDPACRLARARDAALGGPPQLEVATAAQVPPHHLSALHIEIADWGAFFRRYLGAAAADPAGTAADAIVPSPLMPHLMYDWLVERARARSPERDVRTVPLPRPPSTPWERSGADGTHFVSFAEWICPINCIEPARCPATRGPRSWSLPVALTSRSPGDAPRDATAAPLLFHCTHRAYGVGMIDVRDVVRADASIAARGSAAEAAFLVGTVSHCHGALRCITIGAP